MAKEIKAVIKLQIPAGQANPAPPVGPALAQHGLNIAEFCQRFNDATQDKKGFKVPVVVTIYEDRSYVFKVKQPVVADLLKKAAGIEKGSSEPNKKKAGKITKEQLKKIAEQKMPDLNTQDIEQAMKIIKATAENMGIEIEE
jgi:large subunit ribosomal protein L11